MMWQKKHPANEEAELPSSWRRAWLLGFFLVVITLIAYGPVWHAGFIWDDDDFVTNNPFVKSADGLHRLWFTAVTPDYYPMAYSMLWLEWRLWANNAAAFHLVNVLLHAFSAVLLWRVLQRLKIPGAWLAAAIFAVHPVNVESAAWISEGKNTLCMFFYAGALLAWLKFEDSGRRRWYGLALAAFTLALLSKTAVTPLPFVLLGLAWWRRGRVGWDDVRRVVPFFVMAVGLGLATVWFHSHRAIGHDVVRTDGFWSRLAVAGCAVWFYLYKAVLPLNLIFVYPRWQINARNVMSYIPLLLLAAAFVVCWRCRRGRGKAIFFGLTYFVMMLLPILGFLNIYFMRYSLVADHWQYFAIISPIVLAAVIIRRSRVLAAALLLALGALTWQQCGMYANVETLWQTIMRQDPDSWMARSNFATWLCEQGRMDEAISQYKKALQIKPDDAEALRNLGLAFFRQGRVREAIPQYQKALEIEPGNAETHVDLGNSLFQMGRVDTAIPQFQKALEIEPDNVEAHVDLGNGFLRLNQLDEAAAQFQKALETRPDFAEAHNSLGACLYRQGRLDEAIAHYQKAVAIKPAFTQARVNLGNALLQQGRVAEAITQFQQSLQTAPTDARVLNSLAWLLATCPQASLRDGKQAVELARRANELTGEKDPFLLHTLAAAFAEAGRFGDAIQTAQKAIELAQSAGQHDAVTHLTDELKRYQAGLPLHE